MYENDAAAIYDALHMAGQGKDYAGEARQIADELRGINANAKSLLDVGCGTGEHLRHLAGHFDHVEGVEPAGAMRELARAKMPGVEIHPGDMRTLALGRTFDAVVCLFSAIGYAQSVEELDQAVHAMTAHVNPGGVLLVEPWLTPGQWNGDRGFWPTVAETRERTIMRLTQPVIRERSSILTMHYLVGDAATGVRYFSDEHVLTLFTEDEYVGAAQRAGLASVTFRPREWNTSGRLTGIRSAAPA